MFFIEVLILIGVLLWLLYKWSTIKYGVLEKRGVPHNKPLPLIGNVDFNVFCGRSSFTHWTLAQYAAFKDSKFYGNYIMRDPAIFIRDVDVLKKIAIKDFDNFTNHNTSFSDNPDHIFSKSLLALKDQKWREMRNTLTPAFTGSKMRLMFDMINECSVEGVNYLKAETKAAHKGELEIEMKDFFSRFSNDVIASTAFGIKVNSFKQQNNEFYTIGKSVLDFKILTVIKVFLLKMMPKVMKLIITLRFALRIQLLNGKKVHYFNALVFDAMKYRQQNNIVRPDMIHLLLEAKRQYETSQTEHTGEHEEFTDDDLLAQCMVFFFAGFRTVSSCLCFTSYELLMNPEVQANLYQEISDMERELAGKPLSYDALMKLPYLEMVISESLRKWPPAIVTDRVCSADYKLKDDDGNWLCDIKKGDQIFIPIIGFHYDANNFDQPEKFLPERFSEENKQQIKPNTYLPFGLGPRICIGNRLALMEVKSILYHIILKFKIVAAEKTVKDMMNSIKGFRREPKEFWVKLIPRDNL